MKSVAVSTWPASGGHKYFAQFMESARRQGIEPQNADGDSWPGDSWETKEWWRKSAAQARFVKEHADEFELFLFCDSHDVLFAAGWAELIAKYQAIGAPIVFASECFPWPKQEQRDLYPETPLRCRFLNGGFWMGRTEAALKFTEALAERAALKVQCDQGIAVDLFLAGNHGIELDRRCALCHCCNLDSMSYLGWGEERVQNWETLEYPALFHGNGNADMTRLVQHMGL